MEKTTYLENEMLTIGPRAILRSVYFVGKRFLDIFCGFFGVIVLIPLSATVKIASVINKDNNPIFFTQDRIGKNGNTFKLYKFRSMMVGADEELKRLLKEDKKLREEYRINKKLKNDPRVTKVGAILRKTSLDEWPQFINILKGDMNIIGNRPYLPREKEDMGSFYNLIIKTKPGLTGLWQTSGRSDTTFQKRLELESWYSMHCSPKLDIKIFFKTFKTVLCRKGAK
ncbi:sugar transferase [bacterium]|nr:sugar transferase [bacterium]